MSHKRIFCIFGLSVLLLPLFVRSQSINVAGTLDYGSRSNAPLFSSAVMVNVSNTLAETTVGSVIIPGGTMGSNGLLRVTILGSTDVTNAFDRIWRVRLGGQQVNALNMADNRSFSKQLNIWNTNTPTGQVGTSSTNITVVSYGSLQGTFFTGSVDTTSDQTLAVTVSNSSTTCSVNLESMMVTILPFNRPSITSSLAPFDGGIKVAGVLSQFQDAYRPFVNSGIPTTAPALSTAENTVFSTTIPGMAMGSNGTLRVTFFTDQTANGNAKFMTVRYGGQIARQWNTSTTLGWIGSFTLSNRNSLTNQIAGGASTGAGSATSFNQTGGLPSAMTVDSSIDQPLICTVSNAVLTDTITGRAFSVEIERAN